MCIALISALGKSKHPEQALAILREMQQHSAVPHMITHGVDVSFKQKKVAFGIPRHKKGGSDFIKSVCTRVAL